MERVRAHAHPRRSRRARVAFLTWHRRTYTYQTTSAIAESTVITHINSAYIAGVMKTGSEQALSVVMGAADIPCANFRAPPLTGL